MSHLADLALRPFPTLKSGAIGRYRKKVVIGSVKVGDSREKSGAVTDHFGLFKTVVMDREQKGRG